MALEVYEGNSGLPMGKAEVGGGNVKADGVIYQFVGSVDTLEDLYALDTTDMKPGYVYDVKENGKNYALMADGNWDDLGGKFDGLVKKTELQENYYNKTQTYNKSEVNGLLNDKQDKLTPNDPISIRTYTKSNLVGLSYTSDGLGVYSPDAIWYETTFNNSGDILSLIRGYKSNTSGTNGNQAWENWTSSSTIPEYGPDTSWKCYVDIPYTIGQILMVPGGSRGFSFGKLLDDGTYIPYCSIGDGNKYGRFNVLDSAYFSYTNSSGYSYYYLKQTRPTYTDTTSSRNKTISNADYLMPLLMGSYSLDYNALVQIFETDDGDIKLVSRYRKSASQDYVTETTLNNGGTRCEAAKGTNVIRCTPFKDNGTSASNAIPVQAFARYDTNLNLYDIDDYREIAALGNTFDISGQQAYNYIDLNIGAGLAVQNGNLVNTNPTAPAVMTGATSSTAGTAGLAPAPAAGDDTKFLAGDGTYKAATADLTNYYTKTQTDSLIEEKEDSIVAVAPLNKEQVNLASQATHTENDGETFTTPNVGSYGTLIAKWSGSGSNGTFQVQTTGAGNGILDKTKTVALDIVPNEDIEFVWRRGEGSPYTGPSTPKFVLGHLDDNGYFTPIIISSRNFAYNSPYNRYYYIDQIDITSTTTSDISGWTGGTKYNAAFNNLGYVSIPNIFSTPDTAEARLRCYKDSNGKLAVYFYATTGSETEYGSGTFTSSLDFDTAKINCVLFLTYSSTTSYPGTTFGAFKVSTGEQIWNPAKDNFQNQLSLSFNNTLKAESNILGVNTDEYYNQTQTDDLVDGLRDELDEAKEDKFEVSNPLEMGTRIDSTISFDDWAGGTSTYNYDTGEYSHTFDANSLQFTILINIPDDINIDVYSDYWRISDGSCKMVLNQPYWGSANSNLMYIVGNNGTDDVVVARLWYGSGHYRIGESATSTTYPFRDCLAVHTANSTTVNDGNGKNIASGLSGNIQQGVRLKRLQFNCACQVSSNWSWYSNDWGYYWTDSSGAKLKTIKLYTSSEDTVGTEIIVTVTQPKIMLNTDNTLEVDSNGLLTTTFKAQGVTGMNAITQTEYDEMGTYYAYVYSGSTVYVRKEAPATTDTVYTGIDTESSLTITAVGTDSITLSDGNTYTYSETDNVIDSTQYDSTIVYVTT